MKLNIKFLITSIFLFAMSMTKAQVDRSKMPVSGKTPTINLGTPTTYKLPNGLTLLVVENHKLPKISVSLNIDEAPVLEGDKAGISEITSALMGNGTTSISKDAFNEEVDYLAGNISLSARGASASSLTRYFPRILQLMADAALNPNFTQEELDKEKAKLVQGIKAGENSVESIVGRVQGVLVYGKNHPYGEYLTEETINSITLEDVKAFYKKHFLPTNAYMVVSGDINPKEAKKLITKYFKEWKSMKTASEELITPKNAETTQINLVDLSSAVQSEIRVDNLIDLKMSDKDYFPLIIANYILGGGFGSYINMNLREKNGFTYGAGSYTKPNKWTKGNFGVSTKVGNNVVDRAVLEILKEIQRIRNEYVSDEHLAQAKSQYLGKFIMATENPQTTASYAINIKTQNLPDDFYKNYIANINAVTKEDIKRVANKYFNIDNLRFTIVSKASDVADKFENLTFEGKELPVFYFDKYGNPTTKITQKKEVPAGVSVKTILENYLKAIGDVKSVKTILMEAKGEIQGMPVDFSIKRSGNDKFLQTMGAMGMMLSKQLVNGNIVSAEAQGQKIPLSDKDAEVLKKEAGVFPEVNQISDSSLRLIGIESHEGKDVYVVALSDSKKVFYDVASGLKVAEVSVAEMGGQTFETIVTYGDYREVKGIRFPFVISSSMAVQAFEFKVTDLKLNEGVSDADFQ